MDNVNILLQPRPFSPREKEQLVEKLLACRTMRDRSSRSQVVQELSFADSIDRDSNTTNKDDVMNIVNRCLDFSDGVLQLIERIEFREENSQPMRHLIQFLLILFSSPQPTFINIDLLAELYKLTDNIRVAKEVLHKLYRQTGVNGGRLPRRYQSLDEGETLPLMIQELAQTGLQSTLAQSELTHPLLTFVRLLLHRVPDTVKDSLLQWLAQTAEKEHIALAEEYIADISSEQTTQDSHHLLVKFKPSDDKKDEFEIHAWLIHEQNDKTVPIYGDVKEEASLEEIPCILDELISRCEEYANAFIVELFLPFTLLNCDTSETDVHIWKLDVGFGNTIAVSHKYPLVLRSYDRTYEINKLKPGVRRRLRQAWESNWAICKNCGVVMLRWPLKEKDTCKVHLVAWLQEAACLTMMFVPPMFDKTQPHIFQKMLSAGTSVALWPRLYCKDLDEEVIEQVYRNLLEGFHFSTLPKLIWERRKEAARDESLLANYVTLFWDDPYRLPSDAPDAPAQDKYPLAFPRERM
jgi:vWA-MoxR associated protein C-terminal domain/Effector-associated domain 2